MNQQFIEYCNNGNLEEIQNLIEEGADINIDGRRPIRISCFYGHLHIVKYLIEEGADIHYNNSWPLRIAFRHGHVGIVEYLIKEGAIIKPKYIRQAFANACFNGHLNIIEYLLEQQEFDIKIIYKGIQTAQRHKRINIVEHLTSKIVTPLENPKPSSSIKF